MIDLVLVPVLVGVDTSLSTQEQKLSRVYMSAHDQKPACVLFSSACIVSDTTLLGGLALPIEVGISKLNLI